MTQVIVQGYNRAARLLHWLTFLAVISAIILALLADAAPRADKGVWFFWHKSFGVLVLALIVVRTINRLISRVPPLPLFTPKIEKLAADTVHYALYWLLFIVPLLGWAGSSAFGRPPSLFGLFTLPALVEPNAQLGSAIMSVHVIAAFTLSGLIAVHVSAALYHGIVRRDGILTRMVTGTNTVGRK